MLENVIAIQENLDYPANITYILKGPHLATAKSSNQIIFYEFCLKTLSGAEAFCAVVHEHTHTKQYRAGRIIARDLIPYNDDIDGYTYYRLQQIEFEAFQESEERTKKTFSKLQDLYGEDSDFKEWLTLSNGSSPSKLVEYYNEAFGTSETVETLQSKVCTKKPSVSDNKIKK